MSKTKFGTFEELLEITPDHLKSILLGLRELIKNIHPETVEVVRMGDRAATYGLGPKKMIEGYAYILPHKKWVNLGFFKGALLPDPANLLEGTGAKMRHIKIKSIEEVEKSEIKMLIEKAILERREALGK